MKPECDELSTHYRDETLCCFLALRVDRIHNMYLFMVVYMFLFVGWILGKLCHLLGTNFLWFCDWLIFRLIRAPRHTSFTEERGADCLEVFIIGMALLSAFILLTVRIMAVEYCALRCDRDGQISGDSIAYEPEVERDEFD